MNTDNMSKFNKPGFTLVELLLYVVIFGLVVGSFSGAYILFAQSRAKNSAVSRVDDESLFAMRVMTQAIRNSQAISSPSAGNSGSTLSLNMADSSKNPTIFTVSGGVLQMQEGASSAVNLTSSKITISGFTVNNNSQGVSSDNARITFTASFNSNSLRNEFNFTRTYYGGGTTRD